MALVFFASQGVSGRHNEGVADPNRSRLSTSKLRSTRVAPSEYIDPNLCSENPERDTLYSELHYQNDYDSESDEAVLDSHFQRRSADNLYDENEQQTVGNNNNGRSYDLNRLSQSCYPSIENPSDSAIPPLFKWPLDSSIKSRRLSDIRKQVRRLSTVIKMTIENEGMGGSGVAPFTVYVEKDFIERERAGHDGRLKIPVFNVVAEVLQSGKRTEIKKIIRTNHWGVSHPIRSGLWQTLIKLHTKEPLDSDYYWDTVKQMYGTDDVAQCQPQPPAFVHNYHHETYGLNEDGIKRCRRILAVINYANPTISYAPVIYPLTSLLLHYMEEVEAFNCITVMINSTDPMFVAQSHLRYEANWRTFQQLAKKHMKGSYGILKKFQVAQNYQGNCFFTWLWWTLDSLPFLHLVRVLDCYFFEGRKVLYRSGLALFSKWMHTNFKENPYLMHIGEGNVVLKSPEPSILPHPIDKMLKMAFGIRGVSKAAIKKLMLQNENMIRDKGFDVHVPQQSYALIDSPPQQDLAELRIVWSWMPIRMQLRSAKRVYTTQEDGNTLTSFYRKVEEYEPLLIMIRTMDDLMFGAYLSSSLKTRRLNDEHGNIPTFFGNGETFLFTLRPNPKKYNWIVEVMQRQNPDRCIIEHSANLFIHADNDNLCIGGGEGYGIALDHDFQFGRSESCKTFDNPPLSTTPDFKIKVIEAYALVEPVF